MSGLDFRGLAVALFLAVPAQADESSAIGLQSVYVQGASGQWLADWYEQNTERSGPFFSPRIRVEEAVEIPQRLQSDPKSIALLPSTVALDEASEPLIRVPSGVTACLAAVLNPELPIKALGDLHALPNGVRIAVPADIAHLAAVIVDIYGLQSKVVLIRADSYASIRALEAGEVAIAFLSGSDGKRIPLNTGASKSLEVIELPKALITSAINRGFARGTITVDWFDDFRFRSAHETICDPVDIIMSEASQYTPASLYIPTGPQPLSEDANLFRRALAALGTLWRMQGRSME